MGITIGSYEERAKSIDRKSGRKGAEGP